MKQQKGISTTLSILLIVLLVVIVGGVIVYKYYLVPKEEAIENETKKFLGDESKWDDIKIGLKDIQGLFGGRNISISGKGETTVEIATFGSEGLDTKTYNLLLSESEIKEIINVFIENDFITITTKERLGIPDEARLGITLTNAEGKQHKIVLWYNDLRENDRFLNIYQKLLLIEKKAETADWKTFRSDMWKFEIDYPILGWDFREDYKGAPTFHLCRQQNGKLEKKETCIFATIEIIYHKCHDLSLTEIIENSECFMQYAWLMHFEEEIITDSGVKGVRAKGLDGAEEAAGVFFLIPEKVFDDRTYPVLFFEYFLGPWGHPEIRYPFASEKEAILNQMLSTFRFFK